MGFLKTAGKIVAAPVVLPVKAVVGTAKIASKVTVGTAKVAGKMAYRVADDASFHAVSSAVDTMKESRGKK